MNELMVLKAHICFCVPVKAFQLDFQSHHVNEKGSAPDAHSMLFLCPQQPAEL